MQTLDFSSTALMLLLGLRHGLDPDHIAVIDALTLHAAAQRRQYAAWTGALFALGHGLVVTLIATLVSLGMSRVYLPAHIAAMAEWLPMAMLIAVGTINLHALCTSTDYRPTGWVQRLVPRRLLTTQRALGVVAVGAVFAAVFDTITQATAWGYVATRGGGVLAGTAAGLVFTLGMLITDTLDSRVLCRLLRDASPQVSQTRRRQLGYLIVGMSFAAAGYGLIARLVPAMKVADAWLTLTGGAMVVALLALAWFNRARTPAVSVRGPG